MKESQVLKRAYIKPKTGIVIVRTNCHLLDASVPGGHHSAPDDEVLNAKKTGFFDDDLFTDKKVWED
ncbi:hypothetical protein [Prevotella falsenii]|uniref:hypothetical protein n=1 Tax=Prevotella falsenii TaxID=515414 RepID=UPI0004694A44|nr:hypothetical protein [Prevotella falsenii]